MANSNFLHELVGSMSQGAAGNPTVAMIEAGFRHHGLAWRYINMEVAPADLPAAVQGALAMGFRGFNLSMPHKVSVIPLLSGLGESAALIGAVNTVVKRGGRLIGENTDGKGFLASLRQVLEPRGQRIVILGAGGAARAIAVELALAGAQHLTIVNRGEHRGRELVETLATRAGIAADYVAWEGDYRVPAEAAALINATSIGLYDGTARPPLVLETLHPGLVVADVVFSPAQSRLLWDAGERGCTVVDGLGMLVNQGMIAFRYWTNIAPDPNVLRSALEEALGGS